ncbi:hypothetical protein EVAR_24166_1 [Eumeta japonica]|uniref:Uncharacterized protein n=1 Tax=Eumeta variegata TaxID=151549 RepID=A0A4C1W4P7_EUMVA|nr:hypothetical protein EVAR_24166_1 [Eumeta japonica]
MDLPLDSDINSSQIENNDTNLLSPAHADKGGYVRVPGGMCERSSDKNNRQTLSRWYSDDVSPCMFISCIRRNLIDTPVFPKTLHLSERDAQKEEKKNYCTSHAKSEDIHYILSAGMNGMKWRGRRTEPPRQGRTRARFDVQTDTATKFVH